MLTMWRVKGGKSWRMRPQSQKGRPFVAAHRSSVLSQHVLERVRWPFSRSTCRGGKGRVGIAPRPTLTARASRITAPPKLSPVVNARLQVLYRHYSRRHRCNWGTQCSWALQVWDIKPGRSRGAVRAPSRLPSLEPQTGTGPTNHRASTNPRTLTHTHGTTNRLLHPSAFAPRLGGRAAADGWLGMSHAGMRHAGWGLFRTAGRCHPCPSARWRPGTRPALPAPPRRGSTRSGTRNGAGAGRRTPPSRSWPPGTPRE